MLNRGNPLKTEWIRNLLLNSNQSDMVDIALSSLTPIEIINTVRSFGIAKSVIDRFLEELDAISVKSPTIANEVMPTGDVNEASFTLRCVETYQKRASNGKGAKFMECLTTLIAKKKQQLSKQQQKQSDGSKPPSGASSPCSAPASPMMEDAPSSPPTLLSDEVAGNGDFFHLQNLTKIVFGNHTFNLASEIDKNPIGFRELALNAPAICSLLIEKVEKEELLKKIYQEGGADWRELVEHSKNGRKIQQFIEANKEQAEKMVADDEIEDIASPQMEETQTCNLLEDEIERGDERQLANFVFLSGKWNLGDGLRLCSLLFERRDAQTVWNVVVILLETSPDEMPSDCRLIFGFIDAALRRPLAFLTREITSNNDCDLPASVLPNLSSCDEKSLKNLLEIIDRSVNATNCYQVGEFLNLILASDESTKLFPILVDWFCLKMNADMAKVADTSVYITLLLKIYSEHPVILNRLIERQRLNGGEFLVKKASTLKNLEATCDATIQTLLSAIGSGDMKKGWTDRIREATLMCRRLAVLHPGLVLNNLPLLAALMQGRTVSVSFAQFRSHKHSFILENFLSLLLLLQPSVFCRRHKNSLKIIVDSCMEIFSVSYHFRLYCRPLEYFCFYFSSFTLLNWIHYEFWYRNSLNLSWPC